MIHVRETAPFYFFVFFGAPLAMIAARQPGAFFSNRLAFFSDAAAFFSKNTVDDSLWFCCFWTPNTPKFSRRASRAGLLHFPIVLLVLDAKYPKNFPARFARRMASFPYGFACFGTQIPQNSPGALRAPGCLISLYFCMFWIPNTLFFPARFARRIASVSYVFAASGAQILQKIPGALRAPDCLRKSLRGSLRDCLGTKSGNRNLRKRDWPLKKTLQAVGLMIAAPDRPPFFFEKHAAMIRTSQRPAFFLGPFFFDVSM